MEDTLLHACGSTDVWWHSHVNPRPDGRADGRPMRRSPSSTPPAGVVLRGATLGDHSSSLIEVSMPSVPEKVHRPAAGSLLRTPARARTRPPSRAKAPSAAPHRSLGRRNRSAARRSQGAPPPGAPGTPRPRARRPRPRAPAARTGGSGGTARRSPAATALRGVASPRRSATGHETDSTTSRHGDSSHPEGADRAWSERCAPGGVTSSAPEVGQGQRACGRAFAQASMSLRWCVRSTRFAACVAVDGTTRRVVRGRRSRATWRRLPAGRRAAWSGAAARAHATPSPAAPRGAAAPGERGETREPCLRRGICWWH
jgi:hypothetical protein